MKFVVITGVSTGIGYACTAELLRHGYHVFGSVRKQTDGERVQRELGENFTPLLFDVTDEDAVAAAATQLRERIGDGGLAGLVNNAGIVVPGPLMHLSPSDLRRQFEVNVLGVHTVTQAFLPLLGAVKECPHPPGRIVNMSSVSGRIVYPFMGAYAASKHALEAMSDALRRELMIYGIDVIVVEPGTVRTPIVRKFADQVARFASTDYGQFLASVNATVEERERAAIPVDVISKTVRMALEQQRPKTRYPIPRKRFSGWFLPRWLPDRWFDRIVARQLGIQ
ncbi:MAG: SDR family oxidoreductase [Anaerolineae bacterium]